MPTLGDLLKPSTQATMKGISIQKRAKEFRAMVYRSLEAIASPKSQAWGRKMLKRMKYQRRHGLVEAAPIVKR